MFSRPLLSVGRAGLAWPYKALQHNFAIERDLARRLGATGIRAVAIDTSEAGAKARANERAMNILKWANHMPKWAQDEKQPPPHIRALSVAVLAPLVSGAVAVHALASDVPDDVDDQTEQAEYSRTALSWTLHYAAALLAFAGATHWGMALAEFGVPRKSEFMALYYVSRYSWPVLFVIFGWVGTVLSFNLPSEGATWLMVGYVTLMLTDHVSCVFYVAPPWWKRWRAGFGAMCLLSLGILLMSERNMYIGETPALRM
mmetsp:Transcript_69988/g.130854  ORF Transcript_69988/g.130854 Transcript_69988/m.130854 type:complete len:258 (+) Transcript_69988:51-824(+)